MTSSRAPLPSSRSGPPPSAASNGVAKLPDDEQTLGPWVELGDHVVLTGSCSWADKTLVENAGWYPRRTMSAEERLRFYASQFPLTEIDSTYYAPPAEQQARLWAQRTPERFCFDVKAYSLLTGHPTRPRTLWADLRERLSPEAAGKRNIYPHHLDPEAQQEVWRRFESALRPLHEARKLGSVLFQYPPWFIPRRENRREVQALRDRLPAYRICVEFRSPMWLGEGRDLERTLSLLEEHELVFVCVDAPKVSGLPRVLAVTNPDLLVVRFHGRSDSTWKDTSRSAAERFRYLYSRDELQELVPPLAEAAAQARETHLLMNNCYRDYAVRNAAELRDLLAGIDASKLARG
jgi:uncharacterized protein YecE (DUF72 family)